MKKMLLSCAIALICGSGIAQNSAGLRLNLEKNNLYRFSSVTEQTISQTVNGMQQNVESNTDYALSLKMVDATADFIITEVRFDTMIIKTNTMGKVTLMSSVSEGDIKSTETADVMSCFMNRLSKNALYVKMDFSGKVLEIVNAKMFSDIVLKDTSSIALQAQLAAAIKTQVANMVSENSLKTMIESFTYHLPGKQVSTGEEWTTSQKMYSGGMSLDITTKYRLDGLTGNVARITANAEIKAAVNAEPLISGGATVSYDDLKGVNKSTLLVDIRTGLMTESAGKTGISGNLGVSAPGFSMQIPMEISGENKVKALP